LKLRRTHRELIDKKVSNRAKAIGLLDYLFEQPIVNVRLVEQHLNCAFVTAARLLEQFTELGIVKETTGGLRNRRYDYAPYLALFEPAGITRKTRTRSDRTKT
jgi:Fic family protein